MNEPWIQNYMKFADTLVAKMHYKLENITQNAKVKKKKKKKRLCTNNTWLPDYGMNG